MFHPRHFNARPRTTLADALALLLITTLPFAVGPAGRAAPAAGQGPQIPSIPPGQAFRQTNVLSDVPGLAHRLDPYVINPWGLASPLVIACNGTNVIRAISGDEDDTPHNNSPAGPIPVFGGKPTGVANNNAQGVTLSGSPVQFLVGSLDGKVTAWNFRQPSGTVLHYDQPGHAYTGFGSSTFAEGSTPYFYGADFANNQVDRSSGAAPDATFAGGNVPAGYATFNVQSVDGVNVYVTYAKVAAGGGAQPENGAGFGYVRKFSREGVRDAAFAIGGGLLDAPWGLALAPASFGPYGGALLVGNYARQGRVNAYNPSTGAYLGTLQNEAGQPLEIEWLRALMFSPTSANTLYFTSALDGGRHGLVGKLKPTTQTATSLIRFSAAEYTVGEGVGHLDVTVTREGDVSGPANVNYNTFDRGGAGQATQKSDYGIALGRLDFAPGETSKTFRLLLVDDRLVEGSETVEVMLSNPGGTGGGLGSPASALVTVLDNDTTPTTSNPLDDSTFFVRQHYLDFLNREPDQSGLDFWTREIESCGANAGCREVKRVNVSAAFFLSIEFQRTGVLAYLANKAAFGATAAGAAANVPVLYGQFMRDVQQLQRNLTFGQQDFDSFLEANKKAFFADVVARPEFLNRYPAETSPSLFVGFLYTNAALTPTTEERAAAVAEFGGAADTSNQEARARALRRVAENDAYRLNEFNRAFVTMEYFGYLRRDPDESGFQFWLGKLDGFNGDYIRAEMVKAFINSDEYRRRFGS